jgi:tripartite-type tricarboxylate transporter receptor subunit TctC
VAAFLEAELGVPVNVINAPGGGGVTGHARGARARPDGYTVTMMTLEINMLRWQGLTALTWRDFEPVMLVNRDPGALFVRADDDRFRDLPGWLTHVRANPGVVTASGTAAGGIWHLALAGALDVAGLDAAGVRWIPTGGAGPALQELMSGGVDVVACSLPEARSFLASNRIRSLGVMSQTRVAGFPTVPTFREQGVDWSMGTWRGLGLPAGTPTPVTDRLSGAMDRIVRGEVILNGQTLPELMEREGLNLAPEPPTRFAATLAATDAALGELLTSPALASVRQDRFDAMTFPRILLGALVLIAVSLLATRARGHLTRPAAAPRPARAGVVRILEVLAAVAVYALVAERLGFLVSMSAVTFGLLVGLGTRPAASALISAAVVAGVYGLFATVLRVPLPIGMIGW